MSSGKYLQGQLDEMARRERRQTIVRLFITIIVLVIIVAILSQISAARQVLFDIQTAIAPTLTPSRTPTFTPTPTWTPTFTSTATTTPTHTLTPTRTSTPTSTPTISPFPAVLLGGVRVRQEPSDLGKTLGFMYEGDPILVTGVWNDGIDDWCRIIFGARQGWVLLKYVGSPSPIPQEYYISNP